MLVRIREGIDCPPCSLRPDTYIGKVFEMFGVEPVETSSRLFGAWEWYFDKEVTTYEEHLDLMLRLKDYNESIYRDFNVRGTVCSSYFPTNVLEIGFSKEPTTGQTTELIELVLNIIKADYLLDKDGGLDINTYVERCMSTSPVEEVLYTSEECVCDTWKLPFCRYYENKLAFEGLFRVLTNELRAYKNVALVKLYTSNF